MLLMLRCTYIDCIVYFNIFFLVFSILVAQRISKTTRTIFLACLCKLQRLEYVLPVTYEITNPVDEVFFCCISFLHVVDNVLTQYLLVIVTECFLWIVV
jgi:hypothetical protein